MKKRYLLVMALFIAGCVGAQKTGSFNQYTAEQVLVKGKTTKQEVLEKFGAPNIVTKQADYMPKIQSKDIQIEMPATATADEVWTYSKSSMDMSGAWASVFLLGGFGSSTSMKMFTLMIYFDKAGIVQDYSVTTSQY